MRQRAAASYQEVMHAYSWDFDTDIDVLDGGAVTCPTCGESFSPLLDRCPDDGVPLVRAPIPSDPLVGTVLDGRFRILRPLAEGSMGVVYEGVQLPSKRAVAIKVVRASLARDPNAAKRFLREAQMLARISHPNIVDVIDYGEADDCLFLAMELLRGPTLDVALAAAGRFTVRRTCEVAIQICDAIVAAHAQGVVHRDLKPANIMLLSELGDWVKVLDFGLAKPLEPDATQEITFTGVLLGTPLYMAPEAIRCDATDTRSDLYALGCIVHELLTGIAPFDDPSSSVVLVRQLSEPPPPLSDDIPVSLHRLVARLLAKDPAHRPESALEVRWELEACLGELGTDEELITSWLDALPPGSSKDS